MDFKKEELIKSPLNYTGGKYKLLPQILPLLPNNIDTFYDLFCGGTEVGINVQAKKVICSDINTVVIDLLKYFKTQSYESLISEIEEIIHRYNLSESNKYGYKYYGCNSNDGLSKYNKKYYLKLREDYNNGNREPIMFYTMLIFAFNNYIKFNKQNNFTTAVNKRDFNNNLRKKLEQYINKLRKTYIKFENKDFRSLNIYNVKENDFLYCDPPYLITFADYNENWNEQDERDLLNKLDFANSKGVKFALSNVLEHKGKSNNILKKWAENYNINELDYNYGNCNYHTKDKSKDSTVEVLITNYTY